MTILIAGGGIAGLAAALSLHQIGVPCRVFEAVSAPRPLGVGINLLPHAVRELTELGLQDILAEVGIPTAELAYYSKHGQRIWTEPRGREAGYHWPQYSIHRGLLQQALLEAARERLGAQNVLTGYHLAGWTEGAAAITAHFVDRRSGTRLPDQSGKLLIGADGIHSVARAMLHPNEGPPLWNGAILWRGTSRTAPFLTGRSMIMAGHEQQKFVALPDRPRRRRPGRGGDQLDRRTQIPSRSGLATSGLDPGRRPVRLPARIRRLAVQLARRAGGDPGGQRLLRIPDGRSRPARPLDRRPRHSDRRCAHPMYPIGSNGASQGIIDARVLAREIRRSGATPEALLAYEAERRPATSNIILANRGNGPEQVMQLVEQRAPNGFVRIEDVLTQQELEQTAARYKQMAGFDRDALNARGPII